MTKTERLIREIMTVIEQIENHWIQGDAITKVTPVDRAALDEHLAHCIEEIRKLRMRLTEAEAHSISPP